MDQIDSHCRTLDRAWQIVTSRMASDFSTQLDEGMTLPQFFLMRLAGEGGITISEASQLTGVTPAAITLLATRLVRAGMLVRQRDRHDRRIVRLQLTPAGQQRLAALEEKRLALVRRYVASIPPAELDRLVKIVQRLADGLPTEAANRPMAADDRHEADTTA